MTAYALLLSDPAAEPLSPLPFLSTEGGLSTEDARAFLRHNPGFLARNAPFEPASRLSAAAAAAGLRALLVPETELPAPPPALQAEKIVPAGAGIQVSGAAFSVFIPFDGITVLSAAAYDAEYLPDTLQAVKTGLAARLASLAGVPPPPAPGRVMETYFRADLVGGDGQLRLLLRPEALDFSALAGKPSPSSLQNFRRLLEELSSQAFRAARNAFLPAFLAGKPLARLKIASPEAAEAELSRLLLLSRGGKPV
ncbi:MAG: hypothetical protein M0025_05775 [Elusimicrobia bacterium]|nr:hypothetical protein [Elusimicrobiota bacterium]